MSSKKLKYPNTGTHIGAVSQSITSLVIALAVSAAIMAVCGYNPIEAYVSLSAPSGY